jgi:hypothetical protein
MIEVPRDNLPLRRRVAQQPAEWLRAYEEFVSRLHLRPPEDADGKARGERQDISERDAPDDDTLGR